MIRSNRALALLVVLIALHAAACSGSPAAAPETVPTGDATISSGPLDFDTDRLELPAGRPIKLVYVNESPVPHNVALYSGEAGEQEVFVGETIEQGWIVYELPALAPGEYNFRCDLHPEMRGTAHAG